MLSYAIFSLNDNAIFFCKKFSLLLNAFITQIITIPETHSFN